MPTWLCWVLVLWIVPQVAIVLIGTAASYLGAFNGKPAPKPIEPIILRPKSVRPPPPKHSSFPPPAYV